MNEQGLTSHLMQYNIIGLCHLEKAAYVDGMSACCTDGPVDGSSQTVAVDDFETKQSEDIL